MTTNAERGVSSLPPELLLLIFIAARDLRGRLLRDAPAIEITLSHVDSYWRTTALTSPAFWSRISIDCSSKHALSQARCYLHRSSSCPIDVLINSYDLDFPLTFPPLALGIYPARIISATQLILEHSHRMRRFIFRCCRDKTSLECQDLLHSTSAPILQCFSIEVKYSSLYCLFDRKIFDSKDDTMRLKYFETDNPSILPSIDSLRSVVHLGLHKLVTPITSPTLTLTIQSLRFLCHLSLGGSVSAVTPRGTLILPNLLSLRARADPYPTHGLLAKIEAQNLNSLWLDYGANLKYNWQVLDGLNERQTPRFPGLLYLTIVANHTREMHQFLFGAFPSVTHLHGVCPVGDVFAHELPQALVSCWDEVHTVVVSNFSKDSLTVIQFAGHLATHISGCGPKKLLVNTKERISFSRSSAFNPARSIQVETLHPGNYDEYWWNMDEQRRCELA